MSGDDERLLRISFDRTIAELMPAPADPDALYLAISNAFHEGSSRNAAAAAAAFLQATTTWPAYQQRRTELDGQGFDVASALRPLSELFVHRVIMLAYEARRRREALAVAVQRPHWRFVSVEDPMNPPECAAKHGKIQPAQSPFFQDGPPCWRPDCRCRIATLSDFAMQREARPH